MRHAALAMLALVLTTSATYDRDDPLARRVHVALAIADDVDVIATEYDRYPSGRPRLVVAGVRVDDERTHGGQVLLLRFPDSNGGKPAVLQRLAIDERPVEIIVQRVIDPKDIVVTLFGRYMQVTVLYRHRNGRLMKFGETSAYWGVITADLDHDGVPDFISTGCCRRTACGEGIYFGVEHFDGAKYVDDGRHYVHYSRHVPGESAEQRENVLMLDGGPGNKRRKRYVFHIINDHARSARVRLDGEDLVPPSRLRGFTRVDKSVELDVPQSDQECPTLAVTVDGPKGSAVHLLVEERP